MSAISDGYGDSVNELIREKERLLQIQAAERHVDPNDWDDILNEARLTVWQVARKRPDAPPAYVHASTAKRITEVSTRGTWTGHTGVRGRAKDPIRRKDRDTLDDPDYPIVVVAQDVLERVEIAYHEGEIMKAIADLPMRHRQYVVYRFWGGLTNTEIAAKLHVRAGNVERMWRESIKPVLRERLARLATGM